MAEITLHEPQFLTEQIKTDTLAMRAENASLSVVRKYIKNIEDERLKYTRQLDAYKKDVMQHVREVLTPLREYEAELAEQHELEEQQRKQEKLAIIRNLSGFVYFEMHFDIPDKWFNKTYGVEQIQQDINDKTNALVADLQQIQQLCDELNMPAHSEYFNMLRENPLDAVLHFIRRDHVVILNYLQHHDIPEPVTEVPNPDVDTV